MSADIRRIDGTLPGERQGIVLDRLQRFGKVIAAELAVEFGVSEDSIRRDLRELAAAGLCKRVYGGALLATAATTLEERRAWQPERKRALAKVAASLVLPGQILIIDAGSTNLAIAAALPERQQLTVVTNAPDVAAALMGRPGFEVLMLGGRIDHKIGGAVGAQTVRDVQGLRADLCFPGACAIDADSGLWTMDAEEVVLKRAMVEASGETVIVATNDKLLTAATHHTASIAAVTHLVVERDADVKIVARFRSKGVGVHMAS
ncbi:MAG TPA: DeoR/GlpR family DNA-binding transcription regulator [Luteibacter sp.]|jgi:DeoR/GlpR family transcriptional regulator of sugar metabolism|nr:DeoR/GlpR family DNA-binding transcription regulator [Luteibacter sp.]